MVNQDNNPNFFFNGNLELLKKDGSIIIESLLNSFDDKKGIPTDLESYFKVPNSYFEFYSSTLSTTLVAFYQMHILSPELQDRFHNSLFLLRDSTFHEVIKHKKEEDKWAWSVSEGACVFATAWAVWALLETEYKGNRLNEIKDAAMWLIDQQNTDDGFGFDVSCESKIFFTSISLHALRLSELKLTLTSQEKSKIERCINGCIQFILNSKNENENIAFWTTDIEGNHPDATYTLYAIWSLYEDDKDKYKELIKKGIVFIRNDLKDKSIWEIKQIAHEISKKYGTHKIIVSFTPSFPLILLKLGLNPLDELCLKPINWLKNNRLEKGWSLSGYEKGTISFSTVLGLWTIYEWEKHVIRNSIAENLGSIHDRADLPHLNKIKKLKARVNLLVCMIIFVIIVLNPNNIINFGFNLWNTYYKQFTDFGLILTIIVSLIVLIGWRFNFIDAFKKIDNKYFNGKIRSLFERICETIKIVLYGS